MNEQDESKQRRHTYADKNQCAVLSGFLLPIALQTLQSITALEPVDSQVLNVIRIHVRLRPFLYCTQVSKFIVKCAIRRRNAEVTIGYMEDQQFSTTLSLEHRSPDC